jgi:hypothetical protein
LLAPAGVNRRPKLTRHRRATETQRIGLCRQSGSAPRLRLASSVRGERGAASVAGGCDAAYVAHRKAGTAAGVLTCHGLSPHARDRVTWRRRNGERHQSSTRPQRHDAGRSCARQVPERTATVFAALLPKWGRELVSDPRCNPAIVTDRRPPAPATASCHPGCWQPDEGLLKWVILRGGLGPG